MEFRIRRMCELALHRAPVCPDGISVWSGPRRRKYRAPCRPPTHFRNCLPWEIVGVADTHPEREVRYERWKEKKSLKWDAIPFNLIRSKRKGANTLSFVRAEWPIRRRLYEAELTEYYGWIFIRKPISAIEELAQLLEPEAITSRIDAYLEEVSKWLSTEFFSLHCIIDDSATYRSSYCSYVVDVRGYGFTREESEAIKKRYEECHAKGDRLCATSLHGGIRLWVPRDMEVQISPDGHRGYRIDIENNEQWCEILSYNPEMVPAVEISYSASHYPGPPTNSTGSSTGIPQFLYLTHT